MVLRLYRLGLLLHYNSRTELCDRDGVWPSKPEILTVWLLTEKVPTPAVLGSRRAQNSGCGWGNTHRGKRPWFSGDQEAEQNAGVPAH